jgi:hypothetical protein
VENDPSIWQAIMAALRGLGQQGNVDPRAEAARGASQQIAPQLPGAVMPHDALARKERERAMIEAMMGGAQ